MGVVEALLRMVARLCGEDLAAVYVQAPPSAVVGVFASILAS